MNFNALRYIVAVYEEMNMTRAAKKLFVSQSSLSQCVRAVENELGCKLFERSKNMLKPTPMGEYFAYWAMNILQSENRMRERLAELSQNGQRRLVIGLNSQRTNHFLRQVLPEYYRRRGDCIVVIKELVPTQLYSAMQKGTVEFVVDQPRPEWPMVKSVRVFEERLLIAAPASMRFRIKQGDEKFPGIEMAELADKPIIINGFESFAEIVMGLFSRIGSSPNVVLECGSPDIAYEMAAEGLGVTVISEHTYQKDPKESVRCYSLLDYPLTRVTSVIYPSNRRLSEDARIFIAALKDICGKTGADLDETGEMEE